MLGRSRGAVTAVLAVCLVAGVSAAVQAGPRAQHPWAVADSWSSSNGTDTNVVEEQAPWKRQETNPLPAAPTSSIVRIPATAPAGGLSFTRPAVTDPVSYYKIAPSQPVTFAWTFTSLYVSPASLTLYAFCSANSVSYPVATALPGAATSFVWDPYLAQRQPNAPQFIQASYTLRVHDERGPTAVASPGVFNGLNAAAVFGLYSPAAYTPIAEGWTCATCSAAAALRDKVATLAVGAAVIVAGVLIGGADVLWR